MSRSAGSCRLQLLRPWYGRLPPHCARPRTPPPCRSTQCRCTPGSCPALIQSLLDSGGSSSGARFSCTPPAAPALGGGPGSASSGGAGPGAATECLLEIAGFPAAVRGSCRAGECRPSGGSRANVTFARTADPPPDWVPLLAAMPVALLLALAAACAAHMLHSAALLRRPAGGYQHGDGSKASAEAGSAPLAPPAHRQRSKPASPVSESGEPRSPCAGAAQEHADDDAAPNDGQQPAAQRPCQAPCHVAVRVVAAAAAGEPAGPAAAAGAPQQAAGGPAAAAGAAKGNAQMLLFEDLFCAVPVRACSLPGPAPAAAGNSSCGNSAATEATVPLAPAAAAAPLPCSAPAGHLQAAGAPADLEAAAACGGSPPPRPAAAAAACWAAGPRPGSSGSGGAPYMGPDCTCYEPPRHKVILCRVSGRCPVGQVLGVLGPSGSGKTTLLSLLAAAGGGAGADISAGARLGGRVSLAGVAASASERGVLTAHVHQDDLLLPRCGRLAVGGVLGGQGGGAVVIHTRKRKR
jgi:hypothetical protein